MKEDSELFGCDLRRYTVISTQSAYDRYAGF
jgi:hypothetical protein